MKRSIGIVLIVLGFSYNSNGQDSLQHHDYTDSVAINRPAPSKKEPIYKLKPAIDIPLTAIAGSWSYYALNKIYKKDSSSLEQILALNKQDINGFDRWAADVYD